MAAQEGRSTSACLLCLLLAVEVADGADVAGTGGGFLFKNVEPILIEHFLDGELFADFLDFVGARPTVFGRDTMQEVQDAIEEDGRLLAGRHFFDQEIVGREVIGEALAIDDGNGDALMGFEVIGGLLIVAVEPAAFEVGGVVEGALAALGGGFVAAEVGEELLVGIGPMVGVRRFRMLIDRDVLADGIDAREVAPRHRLVDDRHTRSTRILKCEIMSCDERNPQRFEISRRHKRHSRPAPILRPFYTSFRKHVTAWSSTAF